MFTLSLDIILHIVELGNLTISDVFHLYQLNKQLRHKLNDYYFWQQIYKLLFGKQLTYYGINNTVGNYELCLEMNRIFCKFEHVLQIYNRNSITDIISEFGHAKCIPIILHFLHQQRLEFEENIRRAYNYVDISRLSLVENLISSITFNLGTSRIVQTLQEGPITPASYEQFWFNISLLNKSSYKMVKARHDTISQLKLKLSRKVNQKFPHKSRLSFKTKHEYNQFIAKMIKVVLSHFKFVTDLPNKTYAEDLDLLKVYSHHAKGHIFLVQSIALMLIHETLADVTIDIQGKVQLQLVLCKLGILAGDYCILVQHNHIEICSMPQVKQYMRRTQPKSEAYFNPVDLHALFRLFIDVESYEQEVKRDNWSVSHSYRTMSLTGFTDRSLVDLLSSNVFSGEFVLPEKFLGHLNNFIHGSYPQFPHVQDVGELVMNKRTNRVGVVVHKSDELHTIYTTFHQLDKCLSQRLVKVSLNTPDLLMILDQMGLDVIGLLYFKGFTFDNGMQFIPY